MKHQAQLIEPTISPRRDVITNEFVAMLKQAGVVEAYLFGSVARGEDRPESDIDVLVTFDHPFKLVEQLNLMVQLSHLTGRDVEVVTTIDPVFEPYIRPTLVPIPL
jgi:predicted nucleotidyltransferase